MKYFAVFWDPEMGQLNIPRYNLYPVVVVEAQLAEQSLLTLEICGSIPNIGKYY